MHQTALFVKMKYRVFIFCGRTWRTGRKISCLGLGFDTGWSAAVVGNTSTNHAWRYHKQVQPPNGLRPKAALGREVGTARQPRIGVPLVLARRQTDGSAAREDMTSVLYPAWPKRTLAKNCVE